MKVADFTAEKYLRAQKQHAAAVLILLPRNISGVPSDSVKVSESSSKACWGDISEIPDPSVCSSELHAQRARGPVEGNPHACVRGA